MAIAIQPDIRVTTTKSELRQLRANGKIPGVVFGPQVGSIPITIHEKELHPILSRQAHSILQMEVPGQGRHSVIISEVQRDAIVNKLLHVDFHQFNMNEEIRTSVPIEFIGVAAGVKAGGIKTVVSDTVEVKCLPKHLPSSIRADISALEVGDNLSVGELKLPEQVTLMTDPKEVLLSITGTQKETTANDQAAVETEEEAS